MYAVVINEGPMLAQDNAVYFSVEKPDYLLVMFESEDEAEAKFHRFIRFTPTNGPRRGQVTMFPLERVVSISETVPV